MTKKRRLLLGRGLLATLVLGGAPGAALAQVNDWIGANSSNWFDPGNWSFGSVPTIDEVVQVNVANPSVIDGRVTPCSSAAGC